MTNKITLAERLQNTGLELVTSFGSPMLPDFIRHRIGELMHLREKEARSIASEADWMKRREYLQKSLAKSFGLSPLPERTQMNVKLLGLVKHDGYNIQKLSIEPRPGSVVPAHLYIPEKVDEPAPAILFSGGHWIENSKMEPDQQAACIGLVKLGFFVLSYDPVDQGERQISWRCHNHLEAYLVGISQAGFNVWESMRAIDYLQSLPQVDAGRIGMTGASGGGHNTLYVSALDDRVKASVPVCYVNAYENLLGAMRGYNWVGGQDLCNQVARILSYADMGDIASLIAPRPLRIINAMQDPMFPTEGAERAHERGKMIYEILGSGDRISLTLIDDIHSYNKLMREAAYGWFSKWLKGEGDGSSIPEPEMTIARPRYTTHYITATAAPDQSKPDADSSASPEMYCFPLNKPQDSWSAQTAAVRMLAENLPPIKRSINTPDDWLSVKEELSQSLEKIIGPFPPPPPYTPGIVNKFKHGKFIIECIRYESEPGITIPAILYLNEDYTGYQPAIILADYNGKRAPLFDGTVEQLLHLGYAVLTVDLRGTGATSATEFENASDSFMLDRDLFAQRLWDLLQAYNYLASYSVIGIQIDKHQIACVGKGVAGLLALYAGALDERVAAVGCIDAPVSYKEMIQESAVFPASAYLFDVLNHFEIEQVAAMISPRPLTIINPLDGNAGAANKELAINSYAWCEQVYRTLNANKQFKLTSQMTQGGVVSAAKWFLETWKN